MADVWITWSYSRGGWPEEIEDNHSPTFKIQSGPRVHKTLKEALEHQHTLTNAMLLDMINTYGIDRGMWASPTQVDRWIKVDEDMYAFGGLCHGLEVFIITKGQFDRAPIEKSELEHREHQESLKRYKEMMTPD